MLGSKLSAVSCALGITAPVVSLTVPTRVALVICAWTPVTASASKPTKNSTKNVLFIIWSPPAPCLGWVPESMFPGGYRNTIFHSTIRQEQRIRSSPDLGFCRAHITVGLFGPWNPLPGAREAEDQPVCFSRPHGERRLCLQGACCLGKSRLAKRLRRLSFRILLPRISPPAPAEQFPIRTGNSRSYIALSCGATLGPSRQYYNVERRTII